jgi:4-amino-4-deoxy-L-arabinose transferase-like glycosyltransferase
MTAEVVAHSWLRRRSPARTNLALWLWRLRWIAIGWIVVFWRLGYPSLRDPDEAHYAELTREMMQAGNWLVPLLDGQPFIDKPVLFHWLQGLSVTLLGQSEFAVRLPSALAALVLFAVTRWVGVALFGAAIGEWGAIMLATIPATFALASIGLFDMVFTMFLFGAIACLIVAMLQGSRRVEYTGYVLLTLAVMTKGPVALVLAALFIGVSWMLGSEARQRLGTMHWVRGLMLVFFAASPWYVWMYLRFGWQFVQGYLLAGNLYYFTQPFQFSDRAISHTFYLRAFSGAFFPWTLVLVGAGVDAIRRRRAHPLTLAEKLLWTWTGVVLVFFSAAGFKLDHYIYPAAPACCLLAARAWLTAREESDAAQMGIRGAVWVIGGLFVVAGSAGGVYLFGLNLGLPPVAAAVPAAIGIAGIWLLASSARTGWRVPSTPVIPAVALLAVWIGVVVVGFPTLEQARPLADIAAHVARNTVADAPVAIYRLERWRGSFRYYLGRRVQRIESPVEMHAFLAQDRSVYALMLRTEMEKLRRNGVVLFPVLKRTAVVGATGKGLRYQRWGDLVVVTNNPAIPRWRDGPYTGERRHQADPTRITR